MKQRWKAFAVLAATASLWWGLPAAGNAEITDCNHQFQDVIRGKALIRRPPAAENISALELTS
jgi:hypothetical protein